MSFAVAKTARFWPISSDRETHHLLITSHTQPTERALDCHLESELIIMAYLANARLLATLVNRFANLHKSRPHIRRIKKDTLMEITLFKLW